VDAYVWTALAANQGHADARTAHDALAEGLSKDEQVEADKRIDGWTATAE